MRFATRFIILQALASALCSCSDGGGPAVAPAVPACHVTVGAFDIGSATTKMQVAVLDVCAQVVIERLVHGSRHVPYGDDVAARGEVSGATLESGRDALRDLVGEAARHHPSRWLAVATEALRTASNGQRVITTLQGAVPSSVRVISQRQEAQVGFWAAVKVAGVERSRAVSWDVGGESMQLAAWADDQVLVHGVSFGSGDMRRSLLTQIQRRRVDASPNPATREEAELARRYAARHALGDLPNWLERRMSRADTVVVGLGALRYYGDHGGFPDNCSQQGLKKLLDGAVGKTDAEIGGDYARGRVPDIALFLGVMDTLGIASVEIVNADLTDGIVAQMASGSEAAVF